MTILTSDIDTNSDDFKTNAAAMQEKVDEFRGIEQKVIDQAASKRERFHKKGQLLPRERIGLLLDKGKPWIELSSLAGYQMHDDKDGSGAGGGIIAGIGYVSGVRCMVTASNSAIKGGTISPAGLHKSLRLAEISGQNKLPSVTMAQSGGANLNYQADIFVDGARTFANQARGSAAGIPQITVVHGNATAGGAYQPGLSDYVIMVREQAKMFLAGPPLLLAATGEVADDETLGGAAMHCEEAGTAEYLAENDADGIRLAREVVQSLGWNQGHKRTVRTFDEPLYSPDELIGVVPAEARIPYDVREILARVADGSRFVDFKNEYDSQTVCGTIEIHGYACGIIGNNGPITAAGATKAAQFIQLCDQAGKPILFFHNTTGFMVGTESESSGIIKHGSKMIQAVANARVPMISMVIGGSYGAGNYAMCGRGLGPRFIFAWPNSRTAVMGGPQAGKVLRIVTEEKMKRQGVTIDKGVEEGLSQMEQAVIDKLEAESTALFGTARLWDDGLIDPRQTRSLLGMLLDICDDAEHRTLRPNTFGVARL